MDITHMARTFTIAAAISLTGALAVGAAVTATAAPRPADQAFGVMGSDIWTLSNNGACNGTISVYNEVDNERPGSLRVWLTPSPSLTGEHCATTVNIGILNGIAPFSHNTPVHVTERTYVDVHAGTGVSLMSATAANLSKGVSHYVLTP